MIEVLISAALFLLGFVVGLYMGKRYRKKSARMPRPLPREYDESYRPRNPVYPLPRHPSPARQGKEDTERFLSELRKESTR